MANEAEACAAAMRSEISEYSCGNLSFYSIGRWVLPGVIPKARDFSSGPRDLPSRRTLQEILRSA